MNDMRGFRWRLRVMMAERNIKSVTALKRLLADHGTEISSQQLTRVVSKLPDRFNMTLLAALLDVLDCELNDLLQIESRSGRIGGQHMPVSKTPSNGPARRRTRNAPVTEGDAASMPGYGRTFEAPKRSND